MSVNGISSIFGAFFTSGLTGGRRLPVPRGAGSDPEPGLREIHRRASALREALARLESSLKVSVGRRSASGGAVVTGDVSLDPLTATTLASTAEVNATPTSFSPFGPSFQKPGTTSLATVTGVYDGSDGTASMRVKVTQNVTVGGPNPIPIETQIGGTTRSISVPGSTPANTPITLHNGIVISFSSGAISKNDFFDVSVNSTVGSVVNPNLPFNGTRSSYPNFEYGMAITAGSFQVNGTSIAIQAADTLNQVLARINSSGAGVTATFDAAAEKVRLTHNSLGPLPLTISGDTSGFVAAAKLSGAAAVPGKTEPDEIIATVADLSSIQTGVAYINDVAIAVDRNADSVNDVIDRINASGAGVTASLSGGKVSLSSSSPFTLGDGTSGFFTGLGIDEGAYGESDAGHITKKVSGDAVVRALRDVARGFNALFQPDFAAGGEVGRFREGAVRALSRAFGAEGPRFSSDFGLRFNFEGGPGNVLDFSGADQESLRRALRSGPDRVRDLFLEPVSSDGRNLIQSLRRDLRALEGEIENRLNHVGVRVDRRA